MPPNEETNETPAEETKPDKPEDKPQPTATASTADFKAPKGYVVIPEGELQGYRTKGKQLTELEKYRATIESEKQKAAEENARKAGEHEKIISEREKKIAELEDQLATTQRNALVSEASAKLSSVVRSEFARRAMAAEWAAKDADERAIDGAWSAFVEAQKQSDPAAFDELPAAVNHSGGAGNVDSGGGTKGDLKSRLASMDPEVRSAAALEELQLIASGKLDPNWDTKGN